MLSLTFSQKTSITCKKEGKIYVKRWILRLITWSRYSKFQFLRSLYERTCGIGSDRSYVQRCYQLSVWRNGDGIAERNLEGAARTVFRLTTRCVARTQ